jgi:hypothetical protein
LLWLFQGVCDGRSSSAPTDGLVADGALEVKNEHGVQFGWLRSELLRAAQQMYPHHAEVRRLTTQLLQVL